VLAPIHVGVVRSMGTGGSVFETGARLERAFNDRLPARDKHARVNETTLMPKSEGSGLPR